MNTQKSITFLPMVGSHSVISYSIKYSDRELFESVAKRAIIKLKSLDSSLREENFQISTNSADILVKKTDYMKSTDEVISIYGAVFCINSDSPFIL